MDRDDVQETGPRGTEGGGGDADGGDERAEQPRGADDGDCGEGDGQGAEDEELDEAELRARWQAHCNACKLLERDAQSVPQRLLEEARAQRDEAERRWRASKKPHPLHKRMRWAEAELRDAEAKESAHRRELQEHLEVAARRTKELEGRVAIDAARTARKRAALAALHHEAAPQSMPASEQAARMAATGISMDVAPQLSEAIQRLAIPLGDDAEVLRQHLQVVATSLSRVQGVLSEATGQPPGDGGPVHYDIGDATANDDGRAMDDREDDGRDGTSATTRACSGDPLDQAGGERPMEEARSALIRGGGGGGKAHGAAAGTGACGQWPCGGRGAGFGGR